MRGVRYAPLVALVWGVRLAQATTVFYLDEGASVVDPGVTRVLTPAEGDITVIRYGPANRLMQVYFFPAPESQETFAYLHLGPPVGQALVPGVYEATRSDEGSPAAVLDADVTGHCRSPVGRFEIHELVEDAEGNVVTLSLDFEARCADGNPIVGAVRFRTGDAPCADATAGTPCDDGDPCTSGDACIDGSCEGTDLVTPTCTDVGECTAGGTCDHRSGVCRYTGRLNGTICDDGDVCTLTSACTDGSCIGGGAVACDDDSFCTDDSCDPVEGCVYEPKPGTCWVARPVVRAVATARAGGRTARCTLRCQSAEVWTVMLYDDGTYLSPGGTGQCTYGPVTFPDETGAVQQRRGKYRLLPTNLDEISDAVGTCAGGRMKAYETVLEGAVDGEHVVVRNFNRVRVPGRIQVVGTTRTTGRFVRGVGPSGAVDPPLTDPSLPTCDPLLRPRCERQ